MVKIADFVGFILLPFHFIIFLKKIIVFYYFSQEGQKRSCIY